MSIIKLNQSGTHTLEVSSEQLAVIDKYSLFQDLVDSHGYIDNDVLERLRLNVRSIIAGNEAGTADLIDLCHKVLFASKMKTYGLHQLIELYIAWRNKASKNLNEKA